MNTTWVEKQITYTHTLGNGAVVVVVGVPALCMEGEEEELCGFAPEVAERLEALLHAAEAQNPPPGKVISLNFSDDPEALKPKVDLEIRIRGRGFNLGEIPINILERILEKAASAYRIAARAIATKKGVPVPPPPKVAFLSPGSVVLGLKGQEEHPLFPEEDVGHLALDLIFKGVEWAERGIPEGEDPELAVAALESVQELAIREGLVELVRYGGKAPRVYITPETAAKGSERIKEIATKTRQSRIHVFEGVLDVLKLEQEAHLKDLELKPQDYLGKTLSFQYPQELLPQLLRLFGQRVRIVVEEEKTPESKRYRLVEIEWASEDAS